MQTRFIVQAGVRASLRIYWGNMECPSCLGTGTYGYHNAQLHVADVMDPTARNVGGDPEDYVDSCWPVKCDHCDAAVPLDGVANGISDHVPRRQVFNQTLYATPDRSWIGYPQPGDLYYATWSHWGDPSRCLYWSNCAEPHLICILPNGKTWDLMSRASNCTMPDDKQHRCWVRHGDPSKGELVTVDKNSSVRSTCAAGAGSIVSGDYHGFLHNGKLLSC